MNRIKVEIPCQLNFQYDLKVRMGDLNYGNHIANDRFLAFTHEARVAWFQSKGWTENNIDNTNIGIIVVDAAVNFKGQAYIGDIIQIQLGLDEVTNTGFDMYFQMEANGKIICTAKTGQFFFSYSKQKVTPMKDPAVLAEIN